MKRTLIVGAAAAILLAGCSSNEEPAAAEQTTQDSTTASATTTAATTTASEEGGDYPIIGEEARSEGIVITVHSVIESPTISFNDSGYSGSYAEFTQKPARAGGKFFVVDTTVLNDGLEPIDLTCSFPIQNTLTTDGQRQYTTVDEQYNIEGNPGCNDMLQPGFDSPMKFVYEVPAAAQAVAFGFADSKNAYDKPTYVELVTE
ncbi:DUF4352 domain-containing protein [Rhodococcus sp. B10]|uniref:DUF4352 domain-containing protein n=1 Tax=Rhodococcus sp. B10 TaxID=2695876 RepID=UPI001430656B|nr:DUF4352 domain-containing protein [Rhodococcus sp. B10]NIL77574.1 hypothetical protein [Rhodococcus sp. B10]